MTLAAKGNQDVQLPAAFEQLILPLPGAELRQGWQAMSPPARAELVPSRTGHSHLRAVSQFPVGEGDGWFYDQLAVHGFGPPTARGTPCCPQAAPQLGGVAAQLTYLS